MHDRMIEKDHTRGRQWSWGRKSLGNEVESEKNVFKRWEDTEVSREIERSESEIAWTLYIEPLKS